MKSGKKQKAQTRINTSYPRPFSGAKRRTVHEMARDEARHGKAFAGLLERYFGK